MPAGTTRILRVNVRRPWHGILPFRDCNRKRGIVEEFFEELMDWLNAKRMAPLSTGEKARHQIDSEDHPNQPLETPRCSRMAPRKTECPLPGYWLFKSEPTSFSIQDLARAPKKTTFWDGVR